MPRRPRLSAPISFDRVAPIYDSTRALPAELQGEVVDHLASHLRGGRTLDVGAGTGRFSIPLQREKGLEIVAVDVSARMLAVGRGRGLRDAILGDARCLPFRDKAFDRATSNHLLHLIAEWPLAVREIVRVTRVEYLSVIKQEKWTPDPAEEYVALAKASGLEIGPPGLPERRLGDRVPPDRTEPVGGCQLTEPARDVIDRIRDRISRNQWDVPAPLHGRIVRTLRARHRGEEVSSVTTVELAIWTVDRLASVLVEKTPSA
ncbi:MAG: class I SAM-dependent methyltransferase [Thermoplasmata archaeon]